MVLLIEETSFSYWKCHWLDKQVEEDVEGLAKGMTKVITQKIDLDGDGCIAYNDYKQMVLQVASANNAETKCIHYYIHTIVRL